MENAGRDLRLPQPLTTMDWIRPFGLTVIAVVSVWLIMFFESNLILGKYVRDILLLLLSAYSICLSMSGLLGNYLFDLLSKYGVYAVAKHMQLEKTEKDEREHELPLVFWNDIAFCLWCAFMALVLSFTDGTPVFATQFDQWLWEATIVILTIKFFPLLFIRRQFVYLYTLEKTPEMRFRTRLANALFGLTMIMYCLNLIVSYEWHPITHLLGIAKN